MIQTAEAPLLEHYEAEPPREDAVGTWLARLTLKEGMPVKTILSQLDEYVAREQNPDALLTGYILSDQNVERGTTIVFGRDPYPDDTYRTLDSIEYTDFIMPFAEAHGINMSLSGVLPNRFHTIIGRQPGYGKNPPYTMERAARLTPQLGTVSLIPCHFFSTRFNDPERRWNEPAIAASGSLKDVGRISHLAYQMSQRRFPLYTAPQTFVYNAKEGKRKYGAA
jgi:hypothetical protein